MNDFANRLAQYDGHYENTAALSAGIHPEGTYVGRIEKALIEESRRDGDNSLSMNVHVRTESGMAFLNLRVTDFASEKAMAFTKGQLMNLGHTGKLSDVPEFCSRIVGANLEIDVQHEEYEGKTYARKLTSEVPSAAGFPAMDMAGIPAATAPAQAASPFPTVSSAPPSNPPATAFPNF